MARYELKIYGKDDEVVNEYGTNILPWNAFIRAASIQSELKGKKMPEQLALVGEMIKTVFVGLTDEELAHADGGDVMNLFMQICNSGDKIKTPKNG